VQLQFVHCCKFDRCIQADVEIGQTSFVSESDYLKVNTKYQCAGYEQATSEEEQKSEGPKKSGSSYTSQFISMLGRR